MKRVEDFTMPFKSSKQKSWMYANKPALAKKWTKKYGSKIDKGFYGHMKVSKSKVECI